MRTGGVNSFGPANRGAMLSTQPTYTRADQRWAAARALTDGSSGAICGKSQLQ